MRLRPHIPLPVLPSILLASFGCRGAGGATNHVSIALAPASVTAAADSAVPFHASGHLPKYTNVVWTVAEAEQAG